MLAGNDQKRIAIYYEHPEWFKPLFTELERREISYERLLASAFQYDPNVRLSPYSLIVNRMSPSAHTRGNAQAIFSTLHYLSYLKSIGANVL
ncbi:MAG: hypothetical protein KAI06_10410, partial [Anaerolineales bacterium]|nr:hypothetical protein [Anaerolineales bacterium]